MGYYRKFDTIGVICLCEWYVTDFGLHESIEQKIMPDDTPHVSFGITNAEALSIMKSSSPDRGMAEVYPLQDWHTGCSIRDYWVEMEYAEDSVIVKAFYLPTKSGK